MISEAVRVTKSGGVIIVNFVHRYWSFRHFLSFMKNYVSWAGEKLRGIRTELGDYTEVIGSTPIRFHAFTIREALQLFRRKDIKPSVWRKHNGLFSDWFFIVAWKTASVSHASSYQWLEFVLDHRPKIRYNNREDACGW